MFITAVNISINASGFNDFAIILKFICEAITRANVTRAMNITPVIDFAASTIIR